MKTTVDQLAAFGGSRLFTSPKPISNLAQPSLQVCLTYLRQAYEQGSLRSGVLVRELEDKLATFHGVSHCISFNSGFWAIAVTLRTLALAGRTEVIMPSLTYRRMADIAAWAGLVPHFCEVDPVSMTNTADCVRACLNERTALIIGVHPINGLADLDGLAELSAQHGVPLIFDSVESACESHQGRRIGGFGDAEAFSLGASKLINGFEGGYVTTHRSDLAQRLRSALALGEQAEMLPGVPSLDARLSDFHAAMALAGLDELDMQISRNRQRYWRYRQRLDKLPGLELLDFDETLNPGFKSIVAHIGEAWPLERDETIALLNAEMIFARAYYSDPLHRADMRYPHVSPELPTTDALARQLILLPCGEHVDLADVDRICDFFEFLFANAHAIRNQYRKGAAT
jgi:dTDP-4-amino-4,6-dideoxygalactose transaminase